MTARRDVVRQRIVGISAQILDEQLDILEGCRVIARLRGSLSDPDLSDPDLLVLTAVESELEDVPSESRRKYWAPDALAEKERQKVAYIEQARGEILLACRAIVTRWTQPAGA